MEFIMIWYSILHLIPTLIASWLLLTTPSLRIPKLGWLMTIWLVPFLGSLVFILTNVRRCRRHAAQLRLDQDLGDLFSSQASQSIEHAERLASAHHFFPYFKMESYEILCDSQFIERLYDNTSDSFRLQ
jgi:hypothetical protein